MLCSRRTVTLQLQPCEDAGQTACLELAELPHFSRETKRADVFKMQNRLIFFINTFKLQKNDPEILSMLSKNMSLGCIQSPGHLSWMLYQYTTPGVESVQNI